MKLVISFSLQQCHPSPSPSCSPSRLVSEAYTLLCLPCLALIESYSYFKIHFPCPFFHEIFAVSPNELCCLHPLNLLSSLNRCYDFDHLLLTKHLLNVFHVPATGWVLDSESAGDKRERSSGRWIQIWLRCHLSLDKFLLQGSGFLPLLHIGTMWEV